MKDCTYWVRPSRPWAQRLAISVDGRPAVTMLDGLITFLRLVQYFSARLRTQTRHEL